MPSLFQAYLCPRTDRDAAHRSRMDFEAVAGCPPSISLETPSYLCHLLLDAEDTTASDPSGTMQVVLHGEIYRNIDDQAAHLAGQFAHHGVRFAGSIHGSAAILLADQEADQISVITDRVNARRLFYSAYADGWYVSSALLAQPLEHAALDPIGVAWYLSHGTVFNDRTTFDGISVLGRACIHTLGTHGFAAVPYWHIDFTGRRIRLSEQELAAGLEERLIQSMKRRIYDTPDVFLSLSGGYDAAGLAGILSRTLKMPDVQCFTYLVGKPRHDSDEGVAQTTAQALGYAHQMIQGYEGDLVGHVLGNARLGQGVCNCCDELDAWQRLATDLDRASHPVLFVGDEWMGVNAWNTSTRLRSSADVLRGAGIYGLDNVPWLASLLSSDIFNHLEDGIAEDQQQLLQRCAPFDDWTDAKDFLFLDQRLANLVLPWRECFAGRFATVRNPLLDNDILDYMTTVPPRLRIQKRLYKRTITSMYPSLFRIPRARRSNYGIDLTEGFTSQQEAFRAMINQKESRLDAVIAPDLVLQMLTSVAHTPLSSPSLPSRALSLAKENLSPSLIQTLKRLMRPSTVAPETSLATFLRRLLILREALAH